MTKREYLAIRKHLGDVMIQAHAVVMGASGAVEALDAKARSEKWAESVPVPGPTHAPISILSGASPDPSDKNDCQ